jgi:hypothetical protein
MATGTAHPAGKFRWSDHKAVARYLTLKRKQLNLPNALCVASLINQALMVSGIH